jgi:REP element-mobilizing transposase RayT
MSRPKAILQSDFPYNISARCINRDRFDLHLEQVWSILCEELYMATLLHQLRVHSFILMGNHFHLIASTPLANISDVMKRFMEITSKRLGEKSRRINRIWGARHFKAVLPRNTYFMNAYKYNYFNPVRAGIVERCEDYRYSTLRGLLGFEKLLFPLAEDTLLFPAPDETLQWLNQPPSETHLDAIRTALHRSEFKHVKCPLSRKPILGEDEVI